MLRISAISSGGYRVFDDNGKVIAQCETADNARLIAAAPELLAALQAYVTRDNLALACDLLCGEEETATHAQARAAIVKATGGER